MVIKKTIKTKNEGVPIGKLVKLIKKEQNIMNKCKYCGRQLTNEDYLGDFYGKCEGECGD